MNTLPDYRTGYLQRESEVSAPPHLGGLPGEDGANVGRGLLGPSDGGV